MTLERSKPHQLLLFQEFLTESTKFSNTVELYDAVPKYFASTKRMEAMRESGKYLPILERCFRSRDSQSQVQEYKLEIKPARIKDREGKEREYYPSEREELVEEALRKIACDRMCGVFLDNVAGVQFTLYQLQQELKKQGHSIHLHSLIEALQICNRVTLTLQSGDGEALVESALFPILLLSRRRDWEENPKETRCYVQFNPLVTRSINELTFRQNNYEKLMRYRKQLSRWLHRRIYHNFVQAGLGNTYTISASTIINDSGLINNSRFRDRIIAIDEAMDELREQEILMDIKKTNVMSGRKIADVKYQLSPSWAFINEQKQANTRQLRLRSDNLLLAEKSADDDDQLI